MRLEEFQRLAGLEPRKAQVEMGRAVERALASGSIALIEGGTGNGKTFSYLVPLIEWLKQDPERKAVITTSTVLLQQQLLKKDIPQVLEAYRKAEGEDFPITEADVAVLTGARNYVCEHDSAFRGDMFRRDQLRTALGDEQWEILEEMVRDAIEHKVPLSRRDIPVVIPESL